MCVAQGNVLVVAEIDDLELQHVAHLLRQKLQLVGVQEEHSDVLQTAHLSDTQTHVIAPQRGGTETYINRDKFFDQNAGSMRW